MLLIEEQSEKTVDAFILQNLYWILWHQRLPLSRNTFRLLSYFSTLTWIQIIFFLIIRIRTDSSSLLNRRCIFSGSFRQRSSLRQTTSLIPCFYFLWVREPDSLRFWLFLDLDLFQEGVRTIYSELYCQTIEERLMWLLPLSLLLLSMPSERSLLRLSSSEPLLTDRILPVFLFIAFLALIWLVNRYFSLLTALGMSIILCDFFILVSFLWSLRPGERQEADLLCANEGGEGVQHWWEMWVCMMGLSSWLLMSECLECSCCSRC